MDLDKQIEAILFWRGEPMTLPDLCRALKASSIDVKKALQTLKEGLAGRGLALIQNDDEFALVTAPETHELIERLRKEELSRDLGRAALETLSIVLYKGSVSRRDIEYIRGVNSTAILRSLLIRGLVERKQSGSDDLPARSAQAGRVFLYHPTVELLSLLGIAGAEELPEFAAVHAELEAAREEQEKQTLENEDPIESSDD